METRVLEPYRAYTPKPFTKEERDQVTILYGGLHWRAERVLQGLFSNMGYQTQVLPSVSKEDLLTSCPDDAVDPASLRCPARSKRHVEHEEIGLT